MAKRELNCDWKQYYKDHLISIDDAVDKLQDGDVVYLGQATMVPLISWMQSMIRRNNSRIWDSGTTLWPALQTWSSIMDPEITSILKASISSPLSVWALMSTH